MKELIEYITLALVDDPTNVEIKQERSGNHLHLLLRVAKEDMGRIIGKGGRVANAMRTLLRVAAAREGIHSSLDVVEPRQ